MKILEMSPSLAPGGAERFTVDLANELVKMNEVTILVMRKYPKSDFYKKELSTKLKYIQDTGKLTKTSKVFQIFKAFWWVLKLRPDVVHAHTLGINWLILPSIFYPKAKYFFTVHNIADQECTTKIGFWIRRFLFKRNVRAITISQTCERSFEDFFKFPGFLQIDNGCREIKITNEYSTVKKEIESFKPNRNTKVFVCVARIMPQKNHKLLIRSFNKFISDGYDGVLLLIGDYKRFPEAKKELDKIVETDRIHFLGTRNNIPDYLALADYYCLSSLWEGLPISLLEAGLSGCYPISTPAGGVVDVIINTQWGIISSDFSENAYLAALIKAYNTNYNRAVLQRLYEKKFSMKICAEKYLTAFNTTR
ncbi:MAG: glycosyltransferase [Candidatus Phocaeicola faecipullorum]|nr:glycosyltransferase [Candidatus Phocaeicola faecipullorum]